MRFVLVTLTLLTLILSIAAAPIPSRSLSTCSTETTPWFSTSCLPEYDSKSIETLAPKLNTRTQSLQCGYISLTCVDSATKS